ncbi:hypothetical protein CCY99_08765 [Helicobacter sp. 16-1353]|nr:hypothetical protein CCY99_08765 [Helicobacter sp. 16-1353]
MDSVRDSTLLESALDFALDSGVLRNSALDSALDSKIPQILLFTYIFYARFGTFRHFTHLTAFHKNQNLKAKDEYKRYKNF